MGEGIDIVLCNTACNTPFKITYYFMDTNSEGKLKYSTKLQITQLVYACSNKMHGVGFNAVYMLQSTLKTSVTIVKLLTEVFNELAMLIL